MAPLYMGFLRELSIDVFALHFYFTCIFCHSFLFTNKKKYYFINKPTKLTVFISLIYTYNNIIIQYCFSVSSGILFVLSGATLSSLNMSVSPAPAPALSLYTICARLIRLLIYFRRSLRFCLGLSFWIFSLIPSIVDVFACRMAITDALESTTALDSS